MGDVSKIEWTDSTFNPWVGCTKIAGPKGAPSACDHCYAEAWAKRGGNPELWQGQRRRTKTWGEPLKWQRQAAAFFAEHGRRRRVFGPSLADPFDNQVPQPWRDDYWALIRATPDLDWLILTKRPQNMAKMLPPDWGDGYPNVTLMVTAENQEEADRRIPILLKTPAARRGVSYEPALGPVDFRTWLSNDDGCDGCEIDGPFSSANCDCPTRKAVFVDGPYDYDKPETCWTKRVTLDWIIAGGESGPGARPAHPDWFRSVRDQCAAAGVPFLMKQWGEWREPCEGEQYDTTFGRAGKPAAFLVGTDGTVHCFEFTGGEKAVAMLRVGKKRAGRLLDGRTWDQFPAPRGGAS